MKESRTYIIHKTNNFMRSSFTTTLMLLLAFTLITGVGSINIDLGAVSCEDTTGEQGWKDSGHGDNKASESRYEKDSEKIETSACDLAKGIDHEKYEFVMSEEEFEEEFMQLPLWETTFPEQKMCMIDRADLGSTFKDYEAQHCITGDY